MRRRCREAGAAPATRPCHSIPSFPGVGRFVYAADAAIPHGVLMRHLAVAIVVTLLSSSTAAAQFAQQGSKLVGTGATGAAMQGQAVSLSSDGNTAIVGGPNDNTGVGAGWIWTRSGTTWTQQGSKLVGTGA